MREETVGSPYLLGQIKYIVFQGSRVRTADHLVRQRGPAAAGTCSIRVEHLSCMSIRRDTLQLLLLIVMAVVVVVERVTGVRRQRSPVEGGSRGPGSSAAVERLAQVSVAWKGVVVAGVT